MHPLPPGLELPAVDGVYKCGDGLHFGEISAAVLHVQTTPSGARVELCNVRDRQSLLSIVPPCPVEDRQSVTGQ